MLTGLKMFSLACASVFYRLEPNAKGEIIELNFKGFEIQRWNIPTDRAQNNTWQKWSHLSSYHVYSQSYGL